MYVMIMNSEMRQLREKGVDYSRNDIKKLCNDIVSKIVIVNECLFYDAKGDLKEKKLNWDYMIQQSITLTGCEMWKNEIDIDYPIYTKEILDVFLKELQVRLHVKYPNKKVGILVSYNNKRWCLRLHTYRGEEGQFLDESIEEFTNPIVYIIS